MEGVRTDRVKKNEGKKEEAKEFYIPEGYF